MSRKIGICIPTVDHNDWWFTHDLAAAMAYHCWNFPDDEIALHSHQGALIQESRNVLAKRAIEDGAEWLIWLDTDMRFPQNTFDRLMDWDQPVVAANCAKRRRPIAPTARKIDGDDPKDDRPVWPDEEKRGLERVDVVGFAVAAMKPEVFFQIDYPWFDVKYMPSRDWYAGEDIVFCGKLKGADIPLHIDHGLSWAVKHIGQYEYGMNDCLGERELARTGYWKTKMAEQDGIKPQITPAGAQVAG